MTVKETKEEELQEEELAEQEHKAPPNNHSDIQTCQFATALWSPPVQRQRWTDHQEHPVVNWGDIFFDLFFVAAAYNLGNIIKESPNGDGILYFVGCFFPIMASWADKLAYDSRFFIRSNDIWHQVLEVLKLCILASAVVHVRPVEILRNTRDHGEMFAFSLSLLLGALLHCLLLLEVVFKVDGGPEAFYAARRDLSFKMVSAGFYMAAFVVSGLDFYSHSDDDDDESSGENYTPIILCLVGGLALNFLMGVNFFFFFPNDGSHKKFSVPMNVDFCIHRYGEWIMLMLGESILSLLIVDVSDEEQNYYVNFFAGIISVVLLQYMHFRSQPHHAEDHAMRRSKEAGFTFYVLMQVYSAALIVLGVSYKMLLYEYTYIYSETSYYEEDANSGYGIDAYDSSYGDAAKNKTSDYAAADPDHHYARFLAGESKSKYSPEDRQQRIAHLFGASLAIVFVCSDAMMLTHKGLSTNLDRCKCKVTHRTNLTGVVLILARLGLIAVVATLSQYETDPERIALIGWACIVAQLILRGLSNKVFPDKQKSNACANSDHINSHGPKDAHDHAMSGTDSPEHKGNDTNQPDDDEDSAKWPNTTQARASRTYDGSGPLVDETTVTVED